MSLSPVEIAALVAAGAMSASKLLAAGRSFWDRLPRSVAVALPVLVACLPQIAAAAGLVKTEGDLVMLGVTCVALLLPGIAEAERAP